MLLVVPLSLAAALLFAVAAAAQQRAARTAAGSAPGPADPARTASRWLPVLRILHRLLRDRLWLLGWVTNLAGFLTQAAALHLGSIAVVQPLLVAQLLFALPLSTVRSRRRPRPWDWAGAGLVCAGLVVLLSVRGAVPPAADARRSYALLAVAAAVVLIGGLLAVARSVHSRPQERAALVAVAAGVCFAMSAVFITLTTDDLIHRGVGATAADWVGYALAGSTLLGLLLEQDAFASGSLPTAVAAMTITNPVVSYLAGVLVFDATPPRTPAALAAVAVAGLLVGVGVVVLAHSPTVHDELGPAGPDLAAAPRPATGDPSVSPG